MLPAQKVKSTTTSVSHWIKGSISCRTENVIYMLFCAKCDNQYVGQTKTALNLRINNHLSRIRNNGQRENDPTSLVIEHFNDEHTMEDVRVCGLEQVPPGSDIDFCEAKWMAELGTVYPNGLNSRNELPKLSILKR
ncbi:MAG: GIY-YIG nuclease family protein [Gammaproteobacteria bacterium]|nr:GIY-YIG nuclease family protein [Gammaproteobacteria bacterium]